MHGVASKQCLTVTEPVLQVGPKAPVPPSITTQPANATVNPGDSATFQVTATGSAPLEFQWRLNGDLLAGATNDTFVVANVQPPNVGDYTVEVRNAGGSVTSANA